jgi:serine/threonine protein kinase/predicted Zn-dependent protease
MALQRIAQRRVSMTPRLETIKEIFHAALDCERDQLSAFLDRSCAGNEVLRGEVEELLAAHRQAGNFIQTSIAAVAVSIIENGQRELLVGQTIGHYKILERIGSGGMGEVYLASDIIAGRKAALKLLPMRFTGDMERLKRFQQEARTLVGLNHPNILTVYEIGTHNSTQYIVSELIEGETLRQRLMRGGVKLSEVIDIAVQVASALAAAHEAGIVHRDIKPENIMLRPDGYVKVLDFGIAKLAEEEVPVTTSTEEALLLVETNLGSILGTVRYMSPEQARGGSVDERTDVWSLGAMLYEMITGVPPFGGDTPRKVMASILETEQPLRKNDIAQTPVELQEIIDKTLRKDRAERYESANELFEALKALRRKLEFTAELQRSAAARFWLRWRRSPAAVALAVCAAAFAVALPVHWFRNPTRSSIPEKSIAVLPFQNLSKDQENAFFTDGVQEEILSSLAKVADLKVISRTSVMGYKGTAKRNLREVGQQLGVAHVLEGSVQRVANRVRVHAQLINARTDAHVWAQTYDADLSDVFAIQSQIAQTITNQLEAKISAGEKAAIAQPPTTDLTANALYVQARELEIAASKPQDLFEAVRLLEQAVARDPQFALAYCLLGRVHLTLFNWGYDHRSARRELANAAIQNAFRLQPEAGEVHLALARYAYHGFLDYDRARAELDLARRTLPNDIDVYFLSGLLDRRQGRWTEAARNFDHAVELDPRNLSFLGNAGGTYEMLRRYSESSRFYERAIAVSPSEYFFRLLRAAQPFFERADVRALREELSAIPPRQTGGAGSNFIDLSFRCAMAERDLAAVNRALAAMPAEGLNSSYSNLTYPREWFAGIAARAFNDTTAARSSFTAARAIAEKLVHDQPDYAPTWSLLGQIDAAVGRKEEAIREGRHACELLPLAKDATTGPTLITNLAIIYAWTGEKDLALEQLAFSAQIPAGVTYGGLKLDPEWDVLRSDPRFEKIVASLAPK